MVSFLLSHAIKPSVVNNSIVGHFNDTNTKQLLLERYTTFEVYDINDDEIQLRDTIAPTGIISNVCTLPDKDGLGFIIFTTLKYRLCIIKWSKETNRFMTVYTAKLLETSETSLANENQVLVDAKTETITVHIKRGKIYLFHLRSLLHQAQQKNPTLLSQTKRKHNLDSYRNQGLMQDEIYDLDLEEGDDTETAKGYETIKLDQNKVTKMAFVSGLEPNEKSNEIYLAVIYYMNKHDAGLSIYKCTVVNQKLKIETTSHGIKEIPHLPTDILPDNHKGGFYVITSTFMGYSKGNHFLCKQKFPEPNILVVSNCVVSENEIILCDFWGRYLRVNMIQNQMRIEQIGVATIASCLAKVGPGCVYAGSNTGDSQLLSISQDRNDDGSCIDVIEEYVGIGPINDMLTRKVEGTDIDQIITCSGAVKGGSIRLISSGVGIDVEHSAPNMTKGLQNMWSLLDKYGLRNKIFFSFLNATHVAQMHGDEFSPITMKSLQHDCSTIAIFSLPGGEQFIQVTSSRVAIIGLDEGYPLLHEWKPSQGVILHAAKEDSSTKLTLALDRGLVLVLSIDGTTTKILHTFDEGEVSAIATKGDYLAIANWNSSIVKIKSLVTFESATLEALNLSTDVIIRSLLFYKPDPDHVFLLCGLGDGKIYYYELEESEHGLSTIYCKILGVGSKPIKLSKFYWNKKEFVHVCSDHSAIVYASKYEKLSFSSITLPHVTHFVNFNYQDEDDTIALASADELIFGSIHEIKQLDVNKILLPNLETPMKICHQSLTDKYCIGALDESIDSLFKSVLYILSPKPDWEFLHSMPLDGDLLDLLSIRFPSDPHHEYLLAVTNNGNNSSTIHLIFVSSDGTMKIVHDHSCDGIIYSIKPFANGFASAENTTIKYYIWNPKASIFHVVASMTPKIAFESSSLSTINDQYIAVADTFGAPMILRFDHDTDRLVEDATGYAHYYIECCTLLSPNMLIASDSFDNIVVFTASKSHFPHVPKRLLKSHVFHLGDLVNSFKFGQLKSSHEYHLDLPFSDNSQENRDSFLNSHHTISSITDASSDKMHDDEPSSFPRSILYGTRDGAIGIILSIDDDHTFNRLLEVQDAMISTLRSMGEIGDVSISEYRSYSSRIESHLPTGFVDGDLIDSVLSLPFDLQLSIAKSLDLSHQDLLLNVERLRDMLK